jgi:hypothetical protein
MTLMLAGLSIRTDRAGVSRVVRALGLKAAGYRRLRHLCPSRAVVVATLTSGWVRLVLRLFNPLRLNGRLVVVGDGLKVAQEGRKMPAVKRRHPSAQDNAQAPYLFGHSYQALGAARAGRARAAVRRAADQPYPRGAGGHPPRPAHAARISSCSGC